MSEWGVRIYPDFIFASKIDQGDDRAKVFVVELKGVHLKDNDDTLYKQAVFEICNQHSYVKQIDLATLGKAFRQRETRFEMIFDNERQRRITELLHH